jgi:hypothetical protein
VLTVYQIALAQKGFSTLTLLEISQPLTVDNVLILYVKLANQIYKLALVV